MENTKGRRLALPALRFWRVSFSCTQRNAPLGTPLAGTHGRPRRCGSWTKTHSRHQRRRHMAQRLATKRTLVGANCLRPHPIPLHFTLWIDTLNRGARHDGHSELPQQPPSHLGREPLWRLEIRRIDRADFCILSVCACGVNGKSPLRLVVTLQFCGKIVNCHCIDSKGFALLTDSLPQAVLKQCSTPIRSRK